MSQIREAANILIMGVDGKIFLQMRDSNPKIQAPLMWNLWGGKIEEFDEDHLQACVREIKEELKLQTKSEDYMSGGSYQFGDEIIHLYIYQKPVSWNEVEILEGAGAAFFLPEDLADINLSPKTKEILNKYMFRDFS